MQRRTPQSTMLSLLAGALVIGLGAGSAIAMDQGQKGMSSMNHGSMGMHGMDHGAMGMSMMKPPKGFVKVSTALKVPAMEFIAGLGTLWVDPATLKVGGPFLNYDKQGHLLGSTYMVPYSALQAHHDMDNLGGAIAGMKVDHTDIEWSDAHPGVPEAHVHVTNWYVSRADQLKAVGSYHHSH